VATVARYGRDDPTPERHLANVIGAFALDVVTRVEAAVSEGTGLAAVEVTAVSALGNLGDPGLSIEQLRSVVGLSQSATVRLVDRLVERGLVRRAGSARDRRVTSVLLSAAGRRTLAAVRSIRLTVLDEWVATLTADQRARLAPLLDVLVATGIEAAGGAIADFRCRMCDPDACGHPEACPVTASTHPDH
jgi:MarR family transcriptional regulator, negative regulator of the multidrug operon emrRAB